MRLHRFISALAVVVCSGLWAVAPAQAARPGIYEVWGNRSDVAHLRYVRGGQIALEWKTVEPTRGHFDWSGLRAQLNAYHAMHKPATVQINSTTSKPAWLWKLIARCGTTQGQQIPQYWDPLYLKLQHELLSSFAKALKSYSHRGTIALVRSAPNAIGTELTADQIFAIARREGWPAKYRKRGGAFGVIELWVEGWRMVEVLTPEMQQEYLGLGNGPEGPHATA